MKHIGRTALDLFLYFFRIGWFTFGGGWSIVAQIQKDYVEDRHAIAAEELLDIVSVGRSLPGTMIGNVAYLFGYHQGGMLCGVCAVLGIILPPIIILAVLTLCYTAIRDNIYIARALTGVRAVVAPIIFSAVLKLHKGAFPKWYYLLLAVAACILSLWFNVSSILLIICGVAAGLLLNVRQKEDAP